MMSEKATRTDAARTRISHHKKKAGPKGPALPTGSLKSEAGSLFLNRDSLYAPVGHLADQQLVLAAAVERVDHTELLQEMPGFAELADDLPVELDLVDFAVVERLGIVGVRDVQVLMRAGRDAHRLRRADSSELTLEVALGVENLDALV